MGRHIVTTIKPVLLFLCVMAELAYAEESTLLIDTTQGIDNTLDPTVSELNELSGSLNQFEDPEFEPVAVPEEANGEIHETVTDSTAVSSKPTVLIDKTRGIDKTLEPEVTEFNDLSEALNKIESAIPTNVIEETDVEIPETLPDSSPVFTSEPTVLIDKTKGIDKTLGPEITIEADKEISEPVQDDPVIVADPNVLIDKTRGIDKTLGPQAAELKELSKSLIDTEKKEPTAIIETPVVPQPEATIPVAATPDESIGSTPVVTLPSIAPKAVETEKQIAAAIEHWTPGDSDLRILEIRVDQYKLEDVIAAYQYEDIVLIPLGALTEILDLAITVQPGSAQGFIIREDWTFMLDTARTEVVLQGIPEKYDSQLLRELDNDIYVESNLLSRWMLMSFDIDLFSARMWVRSEEKLPFIKRIEREKRIAKSLARLNIQKQVYPKHYEPYKDWSIPFVDQTVQLGLRKNENGETSLPYRSTTYVTADLMKHESSAYLTINDQNGIDDFRLTFGRTDPDGELLGFMQANKYNFGHVSEPRLGLITLPGSQEAGVSVSSYPIGRQTEYDRHRFRGDLLPGWEVELYHNNSIIGYQPEPIEGQYDFPDIPLLFGRNHFRLVFYGPQGQIREETQDFELNQSLTRKGEHYYRATATQDEIDGSRATAQYDYGINEKISSSFAFASIPLQDGLTRTQHTYIKAGVRGFWDAFLGSADFIDDSTGGTAIDLNLQTRVNGAVFGFSETLLSKFFSEEFRPGETELSSRTKFRVDTSIPPSFLPRIPVSLQIKRDEFADGGERLEITNQLSTSVRGFAISNLLTRQTVSGQEPLFNGSFQLSTNLNRLRVRGSASYALQPETELTNIAVTVDPGEYHEYRLNFGLTHSLEQDVTEYSATANKLTGKYNLSFGARLNSNGEINLDLGLSIGIGYEPRRNQWETNARSIANQGSVSARVFLDSNQDGIFGENDEPLEDVGFRLNGGYSQGRTGDDGIVFLTGIPPYAPMNVVIAPETLVDPLWTTALDGVQVSPRPGKAILLDFPIFVSGEIDGTVYLSKDGKVFGVGNVIIELVDKNNAILNTTETAYDGFYVMGNVPLGQYLLRISAKQLDKLELRASTEESIEINADNLFVNGIDFTVTPK